MEEVKSLFSKAKLQFINVVGFALAFVFTFFTWFKFQINDFGFNLGYPTSASLWKYSDLTDFIVFGLIVAGVVTSAMVLMKVREGAVDKRTVMNSIVASALAAGLSFLLASLSVLSYDVKYSTVSIGYYLFALVMLVLAGLNGFKAFQHKDYVKGMAKEMQEKAKTTMNNVQSQAQTAVKTEEKPATKPATEDKTEGMS